MNVEEEPATESKKLYPQRRKNIVMFAACKSYIAYDLRFQMSCKLVLAVTEKKEEGESLLMVMHRLF